MSHSISRETISPSEALKLIAITLNNPSVKHRRIDMRKVYQASSDLLVPGASRGWTLTLNPRGAVIDGLDLVLAMVHVWKPATFDIARGVRAERRGARRAPFRQPVVAEHEIDAKTLRAHANA
jgi:hypothetical protein